ncbi:MAG: hypothetical protein ACRC6T_09365 [Sarcina sp.]
MMKKIKIYLASLLVSFSILSIGTVSNAAQVDTVMWKWHDIFQVTSTGHSLSYQDNQQYKQLTFVNGYSYTTRKRNITTIADNAMGVVSRYENIRTFRTY